MNTRQLLAQQLDAKMLAFVPLQKIAPPATGWVRAVRLALGMTLEQLGKRLSMTKQSAQHLEKREEVGAITIMALREAAQALNMKLVYGFVPNDGSLEALVERKAQELATQIVLRTSNTMKLEDQENSQQRLHKAIRERVAALKNANPKILWD
jgi:predicted DNA-binding mobile mystery protein A